VQDLVKETATLHKVLYKYLHGPTVEHVMGQVLASIDKRLGAELSAVEVKGPEPHQRMTEDKAHLEKKLGTLKGLSWSAEVS
jgi:vacuolar protein sorting-associated protein 54